MYLDEKAELIREALEGDAEPPDDSEYLFVLYAVLARVKGVAVTAADVHDAWAAWMGLTDPNHPALVPFEQLNLADQEQDEPYAKAIRKVAAGQF